MDKNLSDIFIKVLYYNTIQYLSALIGLVSEKKKISKIKQKK